MSLFQSNLRKQIRNLPKILNFVKKIHYYSELFTSLLRLEPPYCVELKADHSCYVKPDIASAYDRPSLCESSELEVVEWPPKSCNGSLIPCQTACCEAWTASCLACSKCQTIEEYCRENDDPNVVGCNHARCLNFAGIITLALGFWY